MKMPWADPRSWNDMLEETTEGDKIDECTLTAAEMAEPFNAGSYRGLEGKPFVAWSETYVYFSFQADNCEQVARVPRHPNLCDNPQFHVNA